MSRWATGGSHRPGPCGPDNARRRDHRQSITNEFWKVSAFIGIARALAATDPDRAERIAQSITDEFSKARVLADIATVLAATGSAGAAWVISEAEDIAQSITNEDSKASALADIASAVAATDPDHAERIAQSITKRELEGQCAC